eukprot:gene17414-24071_t
MALLQLNAYIDELIWQFLPYSTFELKLLNDSIGWLHKSLSTINPGSFTFPTGSYLNGTTIFNESIEYTQAINRKYLEKWNKLTLNFYTDGNGAPEIGFEINLDKITVDSKSDDIFLKINGREFCLSPNNVSSLLLSAVVEIVNNMIGKDHLFKKSIVLIKSWCLNEALSISKDAVELFTNEVIIVMLLWLFTNRIDSGISIECPFDALVYFLEDFSKFDWENQSLYATATSVGAESKSFGQEVARIIEEHSMIYYSIFPFESFDARYNMVNSLCHSSYIRAPQLMKQDSYNSSWQLNEDNPAGFKADSNDILLSSNASANFLTN